MAQIHPSEISEMLCEELDKDVVLKFAEMYMELASSIGDENFAFQADSILNKLFEKSR